MFLFFIDVVIGSRHGSPTTIKIHLIIRGVENKHRLTSVNFTRAMNKNTGNSANKTATNIFFLLDKNYHLVIRDGFTMLH